MLLHGVCIHKFFHTFEGGRKEAILIVLTSFKILIFDAESKRCLVIVIAKDLNLHLPDSGKFTYNSVTFGIGIKVLPHFTLVNRHQGTALY